jgi:hypothetical protein
MAKGDSMFLLLFACTPETISTTDVAETEWIQDIAVSTSALIPTAIEVSYSTPADAIGWVEFGVGSPDELTTPVAQLGTDHSHAVVGNPALTEVSMRVVVEIDGERHTSGTFTHETGQLLPTTPMFEVKFNE